MAEPRLHEVKISHRIMVYAENHSHAEKIARIHLTDLENEWPLVHEIAHCADVEGLQTIVTSEEGLSEGYRDVPPYSDSGETRTCGEILKDEADALEKQRSQPRV